MNMQEIAEKLELTLLTDHTENELKAPSSAYTSDMLSCVMAGAPHEGIWITLQAHANIVAVAALLDLVGVIITEGALPDEATIQKANERDVPLYSTSRSSYEIAGKLWALGIQN